jgi:hypothetical protein
MCADVTLIILFSCYVCCFFVDNPDIQTKFRLKWSPHKYKGPRLWHDIFCSCIYRHAWMGPCLFTFGRTQTLNALKSRVWSRHVISLCSEWLWGNLFHYTRDHGNRLQLSKHIVGCYHDDIAEALFSNFLYTPIYEIRRV